MRILITNDDGIHASGLLPLVRWCQKLGEVTVVAPLVEQSGKSHGIELHTPFMVKKLDLAPDITAYAVDSTPADCVRFAILGLKLEFDLVVSGINRGFNMGTDIMYSGTVGAACEANLLGVPAIALSTSPEYYDHAVTHLDYVLEYMHQHELMKLHPIYNINIPPQPQGVWITCQGGPYYSDDFLWAEDGSCMPQGKCVYRDAGDLRLDTDCIHRGFVSITPLTISKTHTDMFRQLEKLNEQ